MLLEEEVLGPGPDDYYMAFEVFVEGEKDDLLDSILLEENL